MPNKVSPVDLLKFETRPKEGSAFSLNIYGRRDLLDWAYYITILAVVLLFCLVLHFFLVVYHIELHFSVGKWFLLSFLVSYWFFTLRCDGYIVVHLLRVDLILLYSASILPVIFGIVCYLVFQHLAVELVLLYFSLVVLNIFLFTVLFISFWNGW